MQRAASPHLKASKCCVGYNALIWLKVLRIITEAAGSRYKHTNRVSAKTELRTAYMKIVVLDIKSQTPGVSC